MKKLVLGIVTFGFAAYLLAGCGNVNCQPGYSNVNGSCVATGNYTGYANGAYGNGYNNGYTGYNNGYNNRYNNGSVNNSLLNNGPWAKSLAISHLKICAES